MPDTIDKHDIPTSFGAFKPVGHVMIGLPPDAETEALTLALHRAGWAAEDLVPFTPREGVAEMQALIDGAGATADFGYEPTLMRRYLDLSRQGCRWLLVRAKDNEKAAEIAGLAKLCGAVLAVRYRTLTIEELI